MSKKKDSVLTSTGDQPEVFVLPPQLLQKLGIDLGRVKDGSKQQNCENFKDPSIIKRNTKDRKAKQKSSKPQDSSILETAQLMTSSVFLSPTFIPTSSSNDVPLSEIEFIQNNDDENIPLSTIAKQKYKTGVVSNIDVAHNETVKKLQHTSTKTNMALLHNTSLETKASLSILSNNINISKNNENLQQLSSLDISQSLLQNTSAAGLSSRLNNETMLMFENHETFPPKPTEPIKTFEDHVDEAYGSDYANSNSGASGITDIDQEHNRTSIETNNLNELAAEIIETSKYDDFIGKVLSTEDFTMSTINMDDIILLSDKDTEKIAATFSNIISADNNDPVVSIYKEQLDSLSSQNLNDNSNLQNVHKSIDKDLEDAALLLNIAQIFPDKHESVTASIQESLTSQTTNMSEFKCDTNYCCNSLTAQGTKVDCSSQETSNTTNDKVAESKTQSIDMVSNISYEKYNETLISAENNEVKSIEKKDDNSETNITKKVNEIASYLNKCAHLLNKSKKTKVIKKQNDFSHVQQAVETPGDINEIIQQNRCNAPLNIAKVVKTYKKKKSKFLLPKILDKSQEVNHTDMLNLESQTKQQTTGEQVFCICSDFGHLSYNYLEDDINQHLHFSNNITLNCDICYLLYDSNYVEYIENAVINKVKIKEDTTHNSDFNPICLGSLPILVNSCKEINPITTYVEPCRDFQQPSLAKDVRSQTVINIHNINSTSKNVISSILVDRPSQKELPKHENFVCLNTESRNNENLDVNCSMHNEKWQEDSRNVELKRDDAINCHKMPKANRLRYSLTTQEAGAGPNSNGNSHTKHKIGLKHASLEKTVTTNEESKAMYSKSKNKHAKATISMSNSFDDIAESLINHLNSSTHTKSSPGRSTRNSKNAALENTSKIKEVVSCGACLRLVDKTSWNTHVAQEHCHIAWKKGEIIDLNCNKLKSELAKKLKFDKILTCYKCGKTIKNVVLFLNHTNVCYNLNNYDKSKNNAVTGFCPIGSKSNRNYVNKSQIPHKVVEKNINTKTIQNVCDIELKAKDKSDKTVITKTLRSCKAVNDTSLDNSLVADNSTNVTETEISTSSQPPIKFHVKKYSNLRKRHLNVSPNTTMEKKRKHNNKLQQMPIESEPIDEFKVARVETKILDSNIINYQQKELEDEQSREQLSLQSLEKKSYQTESTKTESSNNTTNKTESYKLNCKYDKILKSQGVSSPVDSSNSKLDISSNIATNLTAFKDNCNQKPKQQSPETQKILDDHIDTFKNLSFPLVTESSINNNKTCLIDILGLNKEKLSLKKKSKNYECSNSESDDVDDIKNKNITNVKIKTNFNTTDSSENNLTVIHKQSNKISTTKEDEPCTSIKSRVVTPISKKRCSSKNINMEIRTSHCNNDIDSLSDNKEKELIENCETSIKCHSTSTKSSPSTKNYLEKSYKNVSNKNKKGTSKSSIDSDKNQPTTDLDGSDNTFTERTLIQDSETSIISEQNNTNNNLKNSDTKSKITKKFKKSLRKINENLSENNIDILNDNIKRTSNMNSDTDLTFDHIATKSGTRKSYIKKSDSETLNKIEKSNTPHAQDRIDLENDQNQFKNSDTSMKSDNIYLKAVPSRRSYSKSSDSETLITKTIRKSNPNSESNGKIKQTQIENTETIINSDHTFTTTPSRRSYSKSSDSETLITKKIRKLNANSEPNGKIKQTQNENTKTSINSDHTVTRSTPSRRSYSKSSDSETLIEKKKRKSKAKPDTNQSVNDINCSLDINTEQSINEISESSIESDHIETRQSRRNSKCSDSENLIAKKKRKSKKSLTKSTSDNVKNSSKDDLEKVNTSAEGSHQSNNYHTQILHDDESTENAVVKCCVCNVSISKSEWFNHSGSQHLYKAWHDQEPTLDLEDEKAVRTHILTISKLIDGLICYRCNFKAKYYSTYLKHLKGCDAKEVKEKPNLSSENSAKSTETSEIDSDTVMCCICMKQIERKHWDKHAMDYHYNIAWNNEQEPIDLTKVSLIERNLRIYKQECKTLVCRECGTTRASVIGFYAHVLTCNKSEEEMEKMKERCNICNKTYLYIYKQQHFLWHKQQELKQAKLEEQRQQKEAARNKSPEVLIPGKRKAAQRAINVISDVRKVLEEAQSFDNDVNSHSNSKEDFSSDSGESVVPSDASESESEEYDENASDEDEDKISADDDDPSDEDKVERRKRSKKTPTLAWKLARVPFVVDDFKHFLKQTCNEYFSSLKNRQRVYENWTNDYELVPDSDRPRYMSMLQESCNVQTGSTWYKYKTFEVRTGPVCSIFVGTCPRAVKWAPAASGDCNSYLTVSCYNRPDCPRYRASQTYTDDTVLQIWDFNDMTSPPKLSFCIAIDYGVVWGMDWCPTGARDVPEDTADPRLGLLAIACSDGNVYILVVPHPSVVKGENPVIRLKPVTILRLTNSPHRQVYQATSVCWTKQEGHTTMIVGYADGTVANYDINTNSPLTKFVENGVPVLLPYHDEKAHNSYVRNVLSQHSPGGGPELVSSGSSMGVMLCAAGDWMRSTLNVSVSDATFIPHWSGVFAAIEDRPSSQNECEWFSGGRRVGCARATCACDVCGNVTFAHTPWLSAIRSHPTCTDMKRKTYAKIESVLLSKPTKKQGGSNLEIKIEPLTYEETVNKYGIKLTLSDSKSQTEREFDVVPERFPLSEVTSMAYCTSPSHHNKLAAATHAGIIFLLNTPKL